MSVDYAAGLSHYDDLGVCGLDEVLDEFKEVKQKVALLASWLRHYNGSCVVHVGAGLSTSAGIPDFRGKSGVWTKLLQDESNVSSSQISPIKPPAVAAAEEEDCKRPVASAPVAVTVATTIKTTIPFDETQPTLSHRFLRELCRQKFIRHIVSQNVDGLFLKCNLPRKFISELHGNFYLDECTKCRSRFIRQNASKTMRLQRSSIRCPREDKPCAGYLRDTILDWESPIPHIELRTAQKESKLAKLHICIGSTMQLRPAKDLVCNPEKNKDKKLVIINLQPTGYDKIADLVIHYYADDVMKLLADELNIEIPAYDSADDPTKRANLIGRSWRKV